MNARRRFRAQETQTAQNLPNQTLPRAPLVRLPTLPRVTLGKARCERALQAELGLAAGDDVLVMGIVSRLAEQKGFDTRDLREAKALLEELG